MSPHMFEINLALNWGETAVFQGKTKTAPVGAALD